MSAVAVITEIILFITLSLFISIRLKHISFSIDSNYKKIKEDISFSITPKFISLLPSTEDFVQYAIEVWRLEQKLAKSISLMPDNIKNSVYNSIQKLKKIYEKNDIALIDYTNQKYNDGMNLDVLAIENDQSAKVPIVKETIEPTVMFRGQVVKKAKIILIKS